MHVDSGLHAFGCVYIEVWVSCSNGRKITRPPGGCWMDPVFMRTSDNIELAKDVYKSASDVAIGECLAGNLFKDAGRRLNMNMNNRMNRVVQWRKLQSLIGDPFVQEGRDGRVQKLCDLGIGIVATVPFRFQNRNGCVVHVERDS